MGNHKSNELRIVRFDNGGYVVFGQNGDGYIAGQLGAFSCAADLLAWLADYLDQKQVVDAPLNPDPIKIIVTEAQRLGLP